MGELVYGVVERLKRVSWREIKETKGFGGKPVKGKDITGYLGQKPSWRTTAIRPRSKAEPLPADFRRTTGPGKLPRATKNRPMCPAHRPMASF